VSRTRIGSPCLARSWESGTILSYHDISTRNFGPALSLVTPDGTDIQDNFSSNISDHGGHTAREVSKQSKLISHLKFCYSVTELLKIIILLGRDHW
jgi:hypothetical protein